MAAIVPAVGQWYRNVRGDVLEIVAIDQDDATPACASCRSPMQLLLLAESPEEASMEFSWEFLQVWRCASCPDQRVATAHHT